MTLLRVSAVLILVVQALGAPQYGGSQQQQQQQQYPQQQQQQQQYPATAPQVQCTTTYETIWSTDYIEKIEKSCQTVSETLYRKKCDTVYKQQCNTIYEQVCSTKYRQESQAYTETECSQEYKRDCESRWEEDAYGGKKWVEVPSTCKNNAYDTCNDVQKQKLVQVPYKDCQKVPKQNCVKVPHEECKNEAYQQPRQVCEDVHRKIPQRVSKKVPKKSCGGGTSTGSLVGGGYGGSQGNQGVITRNPSSTGTGGTRNAIAFEKQTQHQTQVGSTNDDAIKFG